MGIREEFDAWWEGFRVRDGKDKDWKETAFLAYKAGMESVLDRLDDCVTIAGVISDTPETIWMGVCHSCNAFTEFIQRDPTDRSCFCDCGEERDVDDLRSEMLNDKL